MLDTDDPRATPRRRPLRLSSLALGLALGSLAGLILALVAFGLFFRDPTPLLTPAALEQARDQWRAQGPLSYNLDLVLSGAQAGSIHIEVRQGKVTHMTRDGRQPSQRRTWDFWSVPNQFDMLRQDLDSAARRPQQAFGVSSGSQVVLRARFDPGFGYPAYYQRIVLGTPNEIEWRTNRFEVVR